MVSFSRTATKKEGSILKNNLEGFADGLAQLLNEAEDAGDLRKQNNDLLELADKLEARISDQTEIIQALIALLSEAGRPIVLYKNDLTRLFITSISASAGPEVERMLEEARRQVVAEAA